MIEKYDMPNLKSDKLVKNAHIFSTLGLKGK